MGDSLRIALFVHHQLTAGTGAPGSTLTLAQELRSRGHHVDVFGLELTGSGDSLWHQLRFPFAAARRVRHALRSGGYDIIDASTGDLWLLTKSEIARSRCVVLTRSHGLEPLGAAARRAGVRRGEMKLRWRYALYHGGWRLHEVRRTLRIADAVLVLNSREREYVTSLSVAPSSVIVTAPLLGAGYTAEPDATTEASVLVAGGVQWRKGGFDNGAVVGEIVRRMRDVRVTWLGVTELSISAHVDPGDRERVRALESFSPSDVSALLGQHRVVVQLSRFEGSSMFVAEALSHGCLVVTTDTGTAAEAVASSGYVVPLGDRTAAVAAVSAALTAPDVAERSHNAAVSAQRFAPQRVIALLEENYRESMRVKRVRSRPSADTPS